MEREEKIQLVGTIDKMRQEKGMSIIKAMKIAYPDNHWGTYYSYKKSLNKMENLREIQTVPHANGDMKRLQIENQRLRTLVVEYALDVQALKDYAGRK